MPKSQLSESEKAIRNKAAVVNYIAYLEAMNNKTGFVQQLKAKFGNELFVLSIGFGAHPIEIPALEEFLKKYDITFRYVGFDLNQNSVKKNQKKYEGKPYSFFKANGTDRKLIQEKIKEQGFDAAHLVVFRHPVLNVGRRDISSHFRDIFTRTVPAILQEGGALCVSIYTDHEKEIADDLFPAITKNHAGYYYLKNDNPLKWKEEMISVGYGYNNGFFKRIPLMAEQYGYGLTGYVKPLLCLAEEKSLKIDNDQLEKWVKKLVELIDGVVVLTESKSKLGIGYQFYENLFAFLAIQFLHKNGEALDSDNVIFDLNHLYQNTSVAPTGIAWAVNRWVGDKDNLKDLKLILKDIVTAFYQLADLQDPTAEFSDYLQALKILALRPHSPKDYKLDHENQSAARDETVAETLLWKQTRW